MEVGDRRDYIPDQSQNHQDSICFDSAVFRMTDGEEVARGRRRITLWLLRYLPDEHHETLTYTVWKTVDTVACHDLRKNYDTASALFTAVDSVILAKRAADTTAAPPYLRFCGAVGTPGGTRSGCGAECRHVCLPDAARCRADAGLRSRPRLLLLARRVGGTACLPRLRLSRRTSAVV
jgi:hypothetical protein